MIAHWYVCDTWHSESPCLYSADAVTRLKTNPPCCLKHGNLLIARHALNGYTREQIRRVWAMEQGRPERRPAMKGAGLR